MKLQNSASLVEISKIIVVRKDRQRNPEKERLEVEDLQKSIQLRGLLNPIIISDEFVLQAGERRLTACQNLGMTKILCRKASDLSPVESQIIELEENLKRLDLDWPDMVKGVAKIHQLFIQLDPDWTLGETADQCGLTPGTVSMYISVFNELENERVAKASTVKEAYNMLQRRQQREAGAALQELLETPDAPAEPRVKENLTEEERVEVEALKDLNAPLPPRLLQVPARTGTVQAPALAPESILHASFLEWAPQYSGPKFNLIHCDFPYGVEVFSGPQGRGAEPGAGYKDSVDTYQVLLKGLCENLDRVMSVSGHLMFWLSADWRIIYETVMTFKMLAPSLKFSKFPLIWMKSDNAGIASDVKRNPRHVYEACLVASRGDRNICRVKGDAYAAPTDKKLHPSTKPEPMLRHFMEMFVDETTVMLDPTCGSGASLRAAESLGAKSVLGLEIDRQYIEPARLALKQARQKRAAERSAEI